MSVTVLGLAGSHRARSNTATLLDWCLAASEAHGAEVHRLRLCDLDLHGCRGCEACFKTGSCVVKDGMQKLYPYLETADSIVLAAPVYSMGMPAVPKMVVDRCQPFWAWKYVLGREITPTGRPERRGAFLSCGGTDFATTFSGISQVVRYLWHVLGVKSVGELLCPGVDGPGEILAQPSARTVAEDIGRRLAEVRPAPENANKWKGRSGNG